MSSFMTRFENACPKFRHLVSPRVDSRIVNVIVTLRNECDVQIAFDLSVKLEGLENERNDGVDS